MAANGGVRMATMLLISRLRADGLKLLIGPKTAFASILRHSAHALSWKGSDMKEEFYKTRAEANKACDLWIGRGYVGSGIVYNPEYAEQENKPTTPYVVIICDERK
jgi:hypothetical protein